MSLPQCQVRSVDGRSSDKPGGSSQHAGSGRERGRVESVALFSVCPAKLLAGGVRVLMIASDFLGSGASGLCM